MILRNNVSSAVRQISSNSGKSAGTSPERIRNEHYERLFSVYRPRLKNPTTHTKHAAVLKPRPLETLFVGQHCPCCAHVLEDLLVAHKESGNVAAEAM